LAILASWGLTKAYYGRQGDKHAKEESKREKQLKLVGPTLFLILLGDLAANSLAVLLAKLS
jgi:hypothetical protein